jgi:transcriptional regulator with XRE-family HTH domain
MDAAETFRRALRAATDPSVEKIAREAGYSRSLFDLYLNRRRPSVAALRALSRVLQDRAAGLQGHAERLDRAADETERGESS